MGAPLFSCSINHLADLCDFYCLTIRELRGKTKILFLGLVTKEHSHPLGDKPLVDVSTDEALGPDYIKLQNELLSLSQNSKQIIAEKSGHFVNIARPDVVVDAIQQVVQSVRNNSKLYKNALPQN